MGRTKLDRSARKKGSILPDVMKTAVNCHLSGTSIRNAAKKYNIPYPTLRRHVLKSLHSDTPCPMEPNYSVNKIFTETQEASLKEYILDCANKFYGLSAKECSKLAFQMAEINEIKYPSTWKENGMAGKDWLRGFKKRNPDLSIKKPEGCSVARATAFNPTNVKSFFDNLRDVCRRHPQFGDGTRIFNLDETATTTVQRPGKVVAQKGQNVSKVISGERGTLVTTCCIVNAIGHALPPVMVLPRVNFVPYMITGAPTGTLGLATKSGWMNSDLFVEVMKHFVKFTASSKDNPSLLIMDNHESHLSIEALDIAKNSVVTVLTLHPHTTSKLQPLDVGLNGPFKSYYNTAVDSWMLRNPGKTFSIYNVAECVGQAYPKAMTPTNIMNAFKKCGIFPYNSDIFSDLDILPSSVTDRPDPTENKEVDDAHATSISTDASGVIEQVLDDSRSSSPSLLLYNIQPKNLASLCLEVAKSTAKASCSQNNSQNFISPKDFRPVLKAGPRIFPGKRKAGKSMIATDTPEKNALAEVKALAAKRKKSNKSKKSKKVSAVKKVTKNLFKEKEIKRRKKNVPPCESSDEDNEEFCPSGS